jgi:prepilin-type N-terminal cleavage/methylation domain-containing protein
VDKTRIMQRSKRGAFTLVEMLVVIGILAFLIAILLPALSKAQAQSQRIKCMSNERQIGQAMLIYAEQYGGYLFPPGKAWRVQDTTPVPNTLPGYCPAPPLLGNADPGSIAQPDGSRAGLYDYFSPPSYSQQFDVWPYYLFRIWNPPVMLCPSDISPGALHSYVLNTYIFEHSMAERASTSGGTATTTTQPATNDLQYSTRLPPGYSPSGVILLAEKTSTVYDMYFSVSDWQTQKVEPYRHGLTVGSNYLFMDMHVETQAPLQVFNLPNTNELDPGDE